MATIGTTTADVDTVVDGAGVAVDAVVAADAALAEVVDSAAEAVSRTSQVNFEAGPQL
ncbi:hypothetical protein [Streptomyces sp. NPDC054786]